MKQLSFYEFSQLTEEQKYSLIFTEGESIDSSIKNDVRYALYKLYSFYVEVIFDSAENKIVSITSFLQSP